MGHLMGLLTGTYLASSDWCEVENSNLEKLSVVNKIMAALDQLLEKLLFTFLDCH